MSAAVPRSRRTRAGQRLCLPQARDRRATRRIRREYSGASIDVHGTYRGRRSASPCRTVPPRRRLGAGGRRRWSCGRRGGRGGSLFGRRGWLFENLSELIGVHPHGPCTLRRRTSPTPRWRHGRRRRLGGRGGRGDGCGRRGSRAVVAAGHHRRECFIMDRKDTLGASTLIVGATLRTKKTIFYVGIVQRLRTLR